MKQVLKHPAVVATIIVCGTVLVVAALVAKVHVDEDQFIQRQIERCIERAERRSGFQSVNLIMVCIHGT